MSLFVNIIGNLAIIFTVWLYFRYKVRKASILAANWAESKGYKITAIKELWFDRGPYFRFSSIFQIVFELQLTYKDGYPRSCGFKIGGWLLGLFDPKIDVVWQEDLSRRLFE